VATRGVEGTDPLDEPPPPASAPPATVPPATVPPAAVPPAAPAAATAAAAPPGDEAAPVAAGPPPPHGQEPAKVHESLLARLHHRVERHHAEAVSRRDEEVHAKAVAAFEKSLAAWQEDEAGLQELLRLAREFSGITTSFEARIPVVLRRDEHVLYVLEGAQLVEWKRLPGHWVGGYSGFSFRIAKGVRYHVGGTRGHYEQGEERPAPIDMGTITITDQRVVFQGLKQAREWPYSKLLGYQHDPKIPMTSLQVSNRQKVSGFLYDGEHAESIHFRLALAIAHYQGTTGELVSSLEQQLATHEAAKPVPPAD
jgi:hypothetical protein